MLMFLNDDDKKIIHYTLTTHCSNCGVYVGVYLNYNQFIKSCPRTDCEHRQILQGLVRSSEHLDFKECIGGAYPYNDDWKRFFNHNKGWT